MKINVVGGGPAGLYLAILLKRARADIDVHVHERNRADDTFGFGVVFSDETLTHFREADPESYSQIIERFAYWEEIDTHYRGQVIRSTGHGFCGIGRIELLNILQQRAESLGVHIEFQNEISDLQELRDCDLLVGADGANSIVRREWEDAFRPTIELKRNRFSWMGSTAPLKAFTFHFKENAHGHWMIHAYRFRGEAATWIIETTPEAFANAGLREDDEEGSARYLEELFAEELQGHRLLTNRSIWRQFPGIKCESWVHRNVVILGDAAHTAHFSIGSGTKLAMEDSIALARCILSNPDSIPDALEAYDSGRRLEVEKTQHAADVSLGWFENVARNFSLPPQQFNFSMLSRSKQITYDNLALRDPDLVQDVTRWFADDARSKGLPVPDGTAPPPMFVPFRLRDMQIRNRVVVSPMCQYKATDGLPNDWHLVHLGSRAVGGAGLLFTEMTNVSADARISPGCTGIYTDAQEAAWKRITDFVHAESETKIALQLGHAGRKGSTQLAWEEIDRPLQEGNWPIISASPVPYFPDSQVPKEMDRADMDRVTADFVQAAERAERAGFDMLEVHMAHGYLLASFISPLTNRRQDEFGGSIRNRMRFPLAVFDAVRAVWPDAKPMSVRLSATDWMPEGLTEDDMLAAAQMLADHGVDLIDVSAGQTVPDQKPVYGRMFQTPFADAVRQTTGRATMAVGNITTADQVNTIVASGRADLVALARPHLADPYFTLRAAAEAGFDGTVWPLPYQAGGDQARATAEKQQADLASLREAARPPKHRMHRLASD
ncbi:MULTISPECIES: bifunctional salicylyl-CoA 5-hydroxylase/oxidoreductase [unclassified Minwuia]|jgi:anthraniloyl-CoA monooxygenase|uniref:bifunctional salicylyl-CoA 5-hydroxylase/oxidoreductase n=1 Tax=unclassified Minwuia TaxID=2618799 RepID=UPI00247B22C1|nr:MULTISPECIES: bifunctional salicylyl-CoA 5-hydroxylase/oxidoreductase [unclassified Minwuia]